MSSMSAGLSNTVLLMEGQNLTSLLSHGSRSPGSPLMSSYAVCRGLTVDGWGGHLLLDGEDDCPSFLADF